MSGDVEFSADFLPNLEAMQNLRDVEVIVGTNLDDPPYPYFLEFGTSRMFARPSARIAYEETKGTMVDTAADVVRQNLARKDFSQRAFRAAGKGAGFIFANRWKVLAPYETGTYKKSIHVETEDVR